MELVLALSALSRFEEMIERLVEDSLAGLLGAPVQPIELAKRLTRALETERAVGIGRALAPNRYVVRLSAEDFARFATARRGLERELAEYLRQAAAERRLSFLAPPTVELRSAPEIGRHQIAVAASFADAPVEDATGSASAASAEHTQRFTAVMPPAPARPAADLAWSLVAAGSAPVPLRRDFVTLGRALDNDVVIEDSRVSRYHAELRFLASGWVEIGRASCRERV